MIFININLYEIINLLKLNSKIYFILKKNNENLKLSSFFSLHQKLEKTNLFGNLFLLLSEINSFIFAKFHNLINYILNIVI